MDYAPINSTVKAKDCEGLSGPRIKLMIDSAKEMALFSSVVKSPLRIHTIEFNIHTRYFGEITPSSCESSMGYQGVRSSDMATYDRRSTIIRTQNYMNHRK